MYIEKANLSDLDTLYALTCKCGAHMREQGIFQWDSNYPSRTVLKNDIDSGELWILRGQEIIKGMIVLTEAMDEEYREVQWLTPNEDNLYVHRLAVLPELQGKGIGRSLMDFAERRAITLNYSSIRLDTFSKNPRNQRFYEQRDYTRLGKVYFKNQSQDPFYAYERVLKEFENHTE
jgi:ribosomal protein S18 acetylase RimI-like enzyme